MNKYLKEILSDNKGQLSSKRCVGVLASISLLISSYFYPTTEIFSMVLGLALGGLGLSSIDKHIDKDKTNNQ